MLRAEVRRSAGRHGVRDDDDRAVVLALAVALERAADALGDRDTADRFTAGAVLRAARLHAGLRAAIDRADATSAKSLGKLLARVEGTVLDGWLVSRCGATAGVTVWRIEWVSGVCAAAE